jgi:hypothetical protein
MCYDQKIYNSGRITAVKQDSSKEFINLLASIYIDSIALPPTLIYKEASGDLQDTWLEDINEKDHLYYLQTYNLLIYLD